MTSSLPLVSIIIPCWNEEKTIASVLDAFAAQTYPIKRMEIIVADGFSDDATRTLVQAYGKEHPRFPLLLIDNPGRTAPAGLNAGLHAAHGDIIMRMDAHAIPNPDYVRLCVDLLLATGCDGVGGAWDMIPGGNTVWSRAIAAAGANPFSTGGARYRVGGAQGEVDTVPFGAYRRDVFDRIGGFNEHVPVNEDYEFNFRVRKAGGKILYSPEIRSCYYARGTLQAMVRQYYMYGHQKAVMLTFHPQSLRIRQVVPALFLPSLAAGIVGGLFWKPFVAVPIIEFLLYGITAIFFAVWDACRRRRSELFFPLPIVFFLIHAAWGIGFWMGLAGTILGRRRV